MKAQVCVAGSGPAVIAVAWYPQKAGIDVILIGGSREHGGVPSRSWPGKDLLYAADAVGLFEHDEPGFLASPLYQGQSPSVRECFVRADVCVLACGAVADVRQLLLSNIGNEHDQIGRDFMSTRCRWPRTSRSPGHC